MKTLSILPILFLLSFISAYSQANRNPSTVVPQNLIQPASITIVKVSATMNKNSGSGIVVGKSSKGLPVILTARSVIAGSEKKLAVRFENQPKPLRAKLIRENWRSENLALIACQSSLLANPVLKYGRSSQLNPGDQIAVVGISSSSKLTYTTGRIIRSAPDLLVLDIAISKSQTGGALVDLEGNVIGIAISRGDELAEAIPIDWVQVRLQQWLGRVRLAEKWQRANNGSNWYGWLIGGALITATTVAIISSGVLESD